MREYDNNFLLIFSGSNSKNKCILRYIYLY